jgi:hypothetical protein
MPAASRPWSGELPNWREATDPIRARPRATPDANNAPRRNLILSGSTEASHAQQHNSPNDQISSQGRQLYTLGSKRGRRAPHTSPWRAVVDCTPSQSREWTTCAVSDGSLTVAPFESDHVAPGGARPPIGAMQWPRYARTAAPPSPGCDPPGELSITSDGSSAASIRRASVDQIRELGDGLENSAFAPARDVRDRLASGVKPHRSEDDEPITNDPCFPPKAATPTNGTTRLQLVQGSHEAGRPPDACSLQPPARSAGCRSPSGRGPHDDRDAWF